MENKYNKSQAVRLWDHHTLDTEADTKLAQDREKPVKWTLSNPYTEEPDMENLSQITSDRQPRKKTPMMPPKAKSPPAPPPSGGSEGVYMSLCVTSSKGNPGQEQGSQYMSLCTATRETGVSAAWRRVETTAAPTQQGSADGPVMYSADGPVYMNLHGQK